MSSLGLGGLWSALGLGLALGLGSGLVLNFLGERTFGLKILGCNIGKTIFV